MDRAKLVKEGIIVVKLLRESISMAFHQLKSDKFRTFLSLFGVTIGIFSIVAIFTAIDALKDNVGRGMQAFNSEFIWISKYPMMGESEEDENGDISYSEYRWWEYMKRPQSTYEEYEFIRDHSKLAADISLYIGFDASLQYGRERIHTYNCMAVTHGWKEIQRLNLAYGRYFSMEESRTGSPVVILGYENATALFGGEGNLERAINKTIKIKGINTQVIGILAKQGESVLMLTDEDHSALVPLPFVKYFKNYKRASAEIYLNPKDGISQEDLIAELKFLMRSVRRLSPSEKDNFSINSMSELLGIADNIFATISIVGWIIAAFSLLIGGFGIANIMFVSVKERVNIIGIQKALGAKQYVILSQFLVEAVFLALAGGVVGALLVCLIIAVVPPSEMFVLRISFINIIAGLGISVVIGVMSGIIPAWVGARLNPVDAINSK